MKKYSTTSQNVASLPEESSPEKSSSAQSTLGKAASKTLINLILLAFIATALIMLGLAWKQIFGVMKQNNQVIAALQNQTMLLQSTLKTQETTLTEQQQSLAELRHKMTQGTQTWILTEAQYLIRLAHFTLQTTGNIALSLSLLQTTDDRIANLQDASLLALRTALAQDTAQLKAIPQDDMAGLLLKLNALMDQVPTLSLKPFPGPSENIASAEAALPWWRSVLHQMATQLKTLVVIQHQKDPLDSFTAAQNQGFASRYLQLLLQEAAWSVLQRQDNLFKSAMGQAISETQRFYAPDSQATQAMLDTLTALSKVDVSFTAPSLTASLSAVENALAHEDKPSSSSSEIPS